MTSSDYDANQVDLIRSRLIRYKAMKRRVWFDVAGDMIESGLSGLVGNANGEGAISEESVRRFAKGSQVPGFERLNAIAAFLIERRFLTESEIQAIGVEAVNPQASGDRQVPIDSHLDHVDLLRLGGGGRWRFISSPVERGFDRRTKIEIKLTPLTSPSGVTFSAEEYFQINYATDYSGIRHNAVNYRRSRGKVFSLAGGAFLIALRDELAKLNRIYIPVGYSNFSGSPLYLIDSEIALASGYVNKERELHNTDKAAIFTTEIMPFVRVGRGND